MMFDKSKKATELRYQANHANLDSIMIFDLDDSLDRIDFKHKSHCFHCGKETVSEVTILRPHRDEMEGYRIGWQVLFEGAVDYEGNKRDMLKRYPEFKGITCDL